MGYITGLVPGPGKVSSSCNKLDEDTFRRQSFKAGSGPIISISAADETHSRRESIAQETRIKFSLPLQKRKSITHQHSQPVLSFRERARGSPRFPHRIVPTCSLTALEDRRKSCMSSSSRRSSQAPSCGARRSLGAKWKSMEDATTTVLPGSRRGSGVLAMSCLPSSANSDFKPRAASYSPNCDVWSTAEFGVPLSDLMSNSVQ